MKTNTKEWIQYGTAIMMLVSGVVLAFLCFLLNGYNINDSVLWYTSQTLVYAGSIFGVSIYVKNKFAEIRKDIEQNK
ncbi:MAG: hypothetical protein ACI3Y0_07290 [Prevotella sp.]